MPADPPTGDPLARLEPTGYGWAVTLPPPAAFLGRPIDLDFETRPSPEATPPPPPTPAELDLARAILADLPAILAVAERRYLEYNAEFPEVVAGVDGPCLWLCREFRRDDDPDRWALVVGIADAPDWGIHLEFRGAEFLEIWSGD